MEALRGRRAHTVGDVWATPGAAREPWLERARVRNATPEEIARRSGSGAHQGICAEVGGYPYVSADELLLSRGGPAGSRRDAVGSRGNADGWRGGSHGSRGDADRSCDGDADRSCDGDADRSCDGDADRSCDGDADRSRGGPAGAHARDDDPLIVALDQVQDPQNLGSICRTAECVGATGVVIPERRAAEVTPAVCKASAGAVEHLRVARVRNLADFLGLAQKAGCWSYGASAGAATPYHRPDYRGGVVLVLGSEGRGLRPRVAGACDELIALPLLGRIESAGVSAAAAAILYEILHNRRRALDNAS